MSYYWLSYEGCVNWSYDQFCFQHYGWSNFTYRLEKRLMAILRLYTVTNFTNAFAFWALLPETKGIGLEEMEKIFEKNEWFVPTSKWEPTYELTHMTEQIAQKQGANHVEVTQA